MASDPSALRSPSLAGAEWLVRPATRAVLETLERGGYGARVVGGAVRNALLGEPVKDIDVATTAEPLEVMRLAEAARLKAVPTGLEHGTVTLIARHVPIEVTTLRRDIETFGRHARVTFTTDWSEDARRRDFTMNALYCGADGTIYDPLGGYADIAAHRVRFIGDPAERIREDYLRILRFFRFTAQYARGEPDPAGLGASLALKDGLRALSGERIRAELLRLLAAPGAVATVSVMAKAGLLEPALGLECDVGLFARTAAIEEALGRPADSLLRLGALAAHRPGGALALRERLKLSNSEFERLAQMAIPDTAFEPDTPEHEAKAYLYRHSSTIFSDGAILAWAKSDATPADPARRARATLPARWHPPPLPVRGADVVALGVTGGPAVGRIVRAFEDWWISEDFPDDPGRLSAALARLAKRAAD
jgi:poly(A) polymerase